VKDDRAQRMLESLDNPIWFALTTEYRLSARSHGLARRYPPDVSPLAALLHRTNDAFADLQRLVSPGEHVALFTATSLDVPDGWQVDRSRWIDQMICEASLAAPPVAPLRLGTTDVPEMLELTAATEPGPFLPQTIQMEAISGYARAMGGWSQWPASDYNPLHSWKSARCALIPNFAARICASSLRMAQKWFIKKLDSVYAPQYI
jgi:hypothetical protein